MVKKQGSQPPGPQQNKTHKTLRSKLRKKRQQQKQHQKQKSLKHKQYNSEQEQHRQKFFSQKEQIAQLKKKKRQDGIKEYKLYKYIQRFIDLYEHDLEDFYQMFADFDEGGLVDIGGIDNKAVRKCLAKMFRYLPLNKTGFQYTKKMEVSTKLRKLMEEIVSKSIQNYLQNGTDEQDLNNQQKQSSDQQNSQQKQPKEKKKKKKQKQKVKMQNKDQQTIDKQQQKRIKSQKQHQQLRQYEKLELYPVGVAVENTSGGIGPSISAEQRQYLAKMFEQQMNKPYDKLQQEQNNQQAQQNQFNRIFSQSTSRAVKKPAKPSIDDIPQQLLAQGSARIGQKQQIDPEQIEQYNKTFRPRKLIEQHQEMRRLGKYADESEQKKRKPFDRERDIVNGRSQFMNNGVFFDFKERMTKPKGTNNFL